MLGPCAFERILVDTWLQPLNNFSAQSGRRKVFEKLGVLGVERGGALEMEKGYALEMEKGYALGLGARKYDTVVEWLTAWLKPPCQALGKRSAKALATGYRCVDVEIQCHCRGCLGVARLVGF